MCISVTCECAAPHIGADPYTVQLPDGATVQVLLDTLFEQAAFSSGITQQELQDWYLILRDYYVLSLETEIHDGDHIMILLNLDGG